MIRVAVLALVLTVGGGLSPARADLPSSPPGEAMVRPGPIGRGDDADATPLLGARPGAVPAIRWLDGRTRSLESLAGRVVLIRSFTNGCPFCAASMPALETLHRDYAGQGLVVLGVYHPKPKRRVSEGDVARLARALGANFPIGLDPEWRLVEGWWTERAASDWTSVTWLLDRSGVLRYLHPGGEYHAGGGADHGRCREDERRIRAIVEQLLAED